MRTTLLLIALGTGCGSAVDEASTVSPEAPAPEAGVDEVAATTGDPALFTYTQAVCRLYTAPDCLEAQRDSCPTHLAFASMAECTSYLLDTARDCERPVTAVIEPLAGEVAACIEALDAHACGVDPFCGPGGRVDAVGPCAAVSTAIAEACPHDEEEFGED